ncbi:MULTISPECIES: hypothetical protein [Okeania]|uniref:Uncharacterized protein n=1 Tax=Okeania hirsuta TaxID=1458930 RepID=A0A3N6NPB2_9CYAN|nr:MULTISPECIES: hypothetical protein [Okeania]NET13604.1 hypothetical protein [Okeania sp. SIO1H6]NET17973.1 hypothetical protein [Okeania sp. SIO1H5]NET76171.1 hypothetical protein [Okeania sp. SIO1F9]NET93053.1 hypothetical protein [Okeania sp. SIO1H2]RQH19381.1 hypothetical protein D4Z78_13860 [Okeania hirsuta]
MEIFSRIKSFSGFSTQVSAINFYYFSKHLALSSQLSAFITLKGEKIMEIFSRIKSFSGFSTQVSAINFITEKSWSKASSFKEKKREFRI